MIISHEHKFIFFAVGKTGTHSVESALKKYSNEFEMNRDEENFFLEHIPPYYMKDKVDNDIWENYFKFAFVRNTWDMVISDLLWNNLIERNVDHIYSQDVKNLFENQKKYRRGITWRESREQHSFLSDKQGNLLVDYVGRFENIQENFNEICDQIGIPKEQLPMLNAQKHKHYSRYYTADAIEMVRQLWATDIEKFGFAFSAPPEGNQAGELAISPAIASRPVRHRGVRERGVER